MRIAIVLVSSLLLVACAGLPAHQQVALVANVLSVSKVVADLGAGKREYMEVDVLGYGPDREKAREDGFRTAVIQSVGSVVVTQTQSTNQRLVRNEIITYSSGFVDRHEVLSEKNMGSEVELRMRVWVAESRIARRLLANSSTAGQIDGKSLGLRLDGVLNERAQGDRLLETVLADFPKRAFDIKLGNHRVVLDKRREVTLEIPFEVKWSYEYLISLYEALRVSHIAPEVCWRCVWLGPQAETEAQRQRRLTQSSFMLRVKPPQNAVKRWTGHLVFDDDLKIRAMHKTFIESRPHVRLIIKNAKGEVSFDHCYSYTQFDRQYVASHHPSMYMFRFSSEFKRASIDADNTVVGVIPIKLKGDPAEEIRKFDQVAITVVTRDQCRRW